MSTVNRTMGAVQIRGGRHACERRGRQHRRMGSPDRAGGLAGEHHGSRIGRMRHLPAPIAVRRAALVGTLRWLHKPVG